ncbi:MAG: PA0069 family radical SAM protein [Rhodocyclaceae bacterium]|nr:PA0069 family radical SAM protein [Rhodocyclaceae bacterium]
MKGRGSPDRPDNRYAAWSRRPVPADEADSGWREDEPSPATELILDSSRSVIARNDSPDVPFDRSVNPYRGCEHGCIYCFARPSHASLGYSPGLDFETKILHKPEAPRLLREELAKPGYACAPIGLGTNTDPWQPVERRLGIARGILEVLAECGHPVTIVTKSALVLRDADLLAAMAARGLVHVTVSVTTLQADLARRLEPRAAAPARRIEVIEALAGTGIPVAVSLAPVIPALNDHEMEAILKAAADAGARSAIWLLLRLPLEVAPLFRDWLERHAPGRAKHVLSLLRQMHGGRENDPRFGHRMRGEGPLAGLLAKRFRLACARLGLDGELPPLDCSGFRRPATNGQMDLFG